MIIDSNLLSDGSVLNYDVCIIGSGPAGISLATELRGTGKKICIIEQGNEAGTTHSELAAGTSSGPVVNGNYLKTSRKCIYGGTGSHWAGYSQPFTKSTLNSTHPDPLLAWPIDIEDLLPYLKRAARILGITPWDDDFVLNLKSKDYPGFSDNDISYVGQFQYSRKIRLHKIYRRVLEKSENTSVYLSAIVKKVVSEKNNKLINKASCISFGGKKFEINARFFILAGGGVGNPQILLNSETENGVVFGNSSGFVGACFSEHPTILAGQLVSNKFIPSFNRRGVDPNILSLPSYTAMESVIYPRSKGPMRFEHFFKRFGQFREEQFTNDLYVVWETYPNKNNKVSLASEKDRFGRFLPILKTVEDSTSLIEVKKYLKGMAEHFIKSGIGRMSYRPITNEGFWSIATGGNHHMCTTRMAKTKEYGVVDKNCRVFGTHNLFVAGSSIFTRPGTTGPTYNLVAFALRLADHLKKEIAREEISVEFS